MENYTTGTGQKLLVHELQHCQGVSCVIHNPSNHSMKDFPTHWRDDIGLMERICPHGIGHPDPDDMAYKELMFQKWGKTYHVGHGCDGCCG